MIETTIVNVATSGGSRAFNLEVQDGISYLQISPIGKGLFSLMIGPLAINFDAVTFITDGSEFPNDEIVSFYDSANSLEKSIFTISFFRVRSFLEGLRRLNTQNIQGSDRAVGCGVIDITILKGD